MSKLELTFADFLEISASLDKGFVFGKDAIVLFPSGPVGMLDNAFLDLGADFFPLFTAFNALVKVTHAFFDVTAKHVFLINLIAASLVDLVTDLGQEALHTIGCRIVVTQFPDDSDTVEYIRDESWDIGWLGLLNLSARILQDFEEVTVVCRFLITCLDLVLKVEEGLQVRALVQFEHLDDSDELGVDQALRQNFEVG